MVADRAGEEIARHPRSYAREEVVFDPLHYLPLIEQKINALEPTFEALSDDGLRAKTEEYRGRVAAGETLDALLPEVASGRIYAGVDVWPNEPIPADDPFRAVENVIISGHRAGGIPEAFASIGDMVCDDLELIAAGLPPVRMQVAAPELVGRYRNRPVS